MNTILIYQTNSVVTLLEEKNEYIELLLHLYRFTFMCTPSQHAHIHIYRQTSLGIHGSLAPGPPMDNKIYGCSSPGYKKV